MVATDQQAWTVKQVYAMAVVCLVLGVAVGYLLHAPKEAGTGVPATSSLQRPVPNSASPSMPSADDMKRMADKQVAPMLAELQKDPKNAALLEKVGYAYLSAQQFSSAKPYYEQSLALKANPETLNELAFVYYSLGEVDKSIDTLHRALKIDPKNPKYLFNLGMFEWHGKTDPKAAIAAWQSFVEADPNNPKRAEVERMIAQAKQHLTIAPGTKTDKPAN